MSTTSEPTKPEPKENPITSGSISRTIVSLAVPVVMGMFMEFALSSTDYFWVGKLGPTAQDSITSSMVIIWTIFSVISIISVGLTAHVARYVGAGNLEKVKFFIKQGIGLALGLGLAISIAGYFLAPTMMEFVDAEPATKVQAVPYLRVFFITGLIFFTNETIYAVFRASGDTKSPTLVGVLAVVINMILDPIFIFGFGPIPAMGVVGASIATGIAVFIAMLVIVTKFLKGKLGYRIERPFSIVPDWSAMFRIAKVGLPVSSQQIVFAVVYWFLIKYVHEFGPTAGAAMGIGNRMESFSYLTCWGFSIAASTMVGQNLGAGKPERAARCAWTALGLAVAITFVMSVLFFTIPRQIASIFSSDPQVLSIAVDYLVILGLSQTAMAFEIVLDGAFGGAGDTLPPMLVLMPASMARVPLAYFLAFELDWGINGIWWTLTITSVAKAIILGFMFKRGKWKHKAL